MNKLLLSLLAAFSLVAQNTPIVTGPNPSVELGNVTYNMGTMRVYVGSGAPTTVVTPSGTPPVQGDFYIDTANSISYQCFTGSCVSSGWVRSATPTVVSVRAFGVNGSTADASNMQTALTAGANNFCLYIPTGLTVNLANNHISLPSGTCLTGDGPSASKMAGSGFATPNLGVIDIPLGSSNISVSNIGIDGGFNGIPVGVLYSTATAAGAAGSIFTTGSTFWIHGSSNITFKNILVQHTVGYSVFSDATAGNVSNLRIIGSSFINNRPNLFSNSGSFLYGSWTGGVLLYSTGASFNHQAVLLDGNTCQNSTGNCFWTSRGTSGSLMNLGITVTHNTCIDVGLDCTQAAWTNNYIETSNTAIRFGYVVISDVGAARIGGPQWLQGFTPVAFDTYGFLDNFTRSNNVAEGNGEMLDLDGFASGVISGNTFQSCFISPDPLANSGQCGPSTAVGVNWTRGLTTNNSATLGSGGPLVVTGNNFRGVGNGGMALFGVQNSIITGNTIYQTADNSNPIVLGNEASSFYRATNNLVSNNTIYWSPGSGAPAVFEDGTLLAFNSGQVNFVRNNTIIPAGGNAFEFLKANPDFSGTGALQLSSVTPGAVGITAAVLQAEGSGAPVLNMYANNGAGLRLFTVTATGALPIKALFTNLPAIAGPGQFLYCTDCTPGSSPCSGSGSGHMAVTNASQWNCN